MSPRRLFRHPAARYGCALLCFVSLGLFAAKTLRIETDFSAFLPPSATAEQRLLVSQLRDGLVSRLMLVALDGADEATLARSSRALAERLGREPEFDYAANGSLEQFAAQGEVLMRHRYALSPDVDASKFTAPALRAALQERLVQLASPLGMVSRSVLARDPTGEFFATLRGFDPGTLPALRHGVWFSADGKRAFLIAQTRAAGFDSARQAEAIAKVRATAAAIDPQVTVALTGPGVFAAESRRLIERDARILSACSALVILAMLALVYRSVLPVALVMTPVAFGLLIGVLLVQALFGSVHAITLAFAATLLGEAVDYPNYLLLNTAADETAAAASRRIGRTLALAALTTVASAMALTLSGFKGLAQLGVLTMTGVAVAGLATSRLIPWLLADRHLAFRRLRVGAPAFVVNATSAAGWPRWLALVATLTAAAGLAWSHPSWWEQDLAGLSPAPAQMRVLDASLRAEMGAPEVSIFLASHGDSESAALQAAENIQLLLQQWKERGWIRSYDSAARYLPSPATQAVRLRGLPDTPTLEKALREAMRGLAFRADAFAPFVHDVAAARDLPPVTRATYAGTPLGAKLNALVIELEGRWLVLTPLGVVSDAGKIAETLAALPEGNNALVDLRQVSAQMLDGYRSEALVQAAWGTLLIVLLLVAGLRSLRRSWRVAAPAAAALVLTVAILAASGQKLSVFHLVALLLVLGIGLNYALFFERPPADASDSERTRMALAVCSVSTIATFGFLALSSTPVLRAIGSTVALGALLSLLLAALWARPAGFAPGTET